MPGIKLSCPNPLFSCCDLWTMLQGQEGSMSVTKTRMWSTVNSGNRAQLHISTSSLYSEPYLWLWGGFRSASRLVRVRTCLSLWLGFTALPDMKGSFPQHSGRVLWFRKLMQTDSFLGCALGTLHSAFASPLSTTNAFLLHPRVCFQPCRGQQTGICARLPPAFHLQGKFHSLTEVVLSALVLLSLMFTWLLYRVSLPHIPFFSRHFKAWWSWVFRGFCWLMHWYSSPSTLSQALLHSTDAVTPLPPLQHNLWDAASHDFTPVQCMTAPCAFFPWEEVPVSHKVIADPSPGLLFHVSN